MNSGLKIGCSGDHAYVVWADDRSGNFDIFCNSSQDAGATWLSDELRLDTDLAGAARSVVPQVSSAGGRVCVVWMDEREGPAYIYSNRSSDGGVTWEGTDVRLDTPPAGSGLAHSPQISRVGDRVYVVWTDFRNGNGDIHLNRSLDSGANWLAVDQRMDTDTPGSADSQTPQISSAGSRVDVVWKDGRRISDSS